MPLPTLSAARLAYLDLMREIEDFLHHEAELLDERRFEAWLELLTDDIHYWMPLRKNLAFEDSDRDITAEGDIAWIDDDKATLSKRVRQILTGIHWAEEPLSRASHLVTNISLADPGAFHADPTAAYHDGAQINIKCRFLVHRNRLETETDFLVGRREDTLRRVGNELRIAKRKIIIDQSVLLAKNLTIFI
jgi:3-phenylpropionate/cinnamic acid dioxygenase small subunit